MINILLSILFCIVLMFAFLGFIGLLMTAKGNMPDSNNFREQAKKLRGENDSLR